MNFFLFLHFFWGVSRSLGGQIGGQLLAMDVFLFCGGLDVLISQSQNGIGYHFVRWFFLLNWDGILFPEYLGKKVKIFSFGSTKMNLSALFTPCYWRSLDIWTGHLAIPKRSPAELPETHILDNIFSNSGCFWFEQLKPTDNDLSPMPRPSFWLFFSFHPSAVGNLAGARGVPSSCWEISLHWNKTAKNQQCLYYWKLQTYHAIVNASRVGIVF